MPSNSLSLWSNGGPIDVSGPSLVSEETLEELLSMETLIHNCTGHHHPWTFIPIIPCLTMDTVKAEMLSYPSKCWQRDEEFNPLSSINYVSASWHSWTVVWSLSSEHRLENVMWPASHLGNITLASEPECLCMHHHGSTTVSHHKLSAHQLWDNVCWCHPPNVTYYTILSSRSQPAQPNKFILKNMELPFLYWQSDHRSV